ncbi:MAG TPA: DUF1566 domain-containing protein [Candidatus Polarisedimenticolia bacterium]|jgi:hypothetical protein
MDLRSWDLKLPAGTRFVVLSSSPSNFGGAAVLDRETQLVWGKSPDTAFKSWEQALIDCYSKDVGGRRGWRLPTEEELFSLVLLDPNLPFGPTLPSGHPFMNIQSGTYWSNTRIDLINSTQLKAWGVDFGSGSIASAR